MTSTSDFDSAIRAALQEPSRSGASKIENLYRQSAEQGLQDSFRAAVMRIRAAIGQSPLMDFWGYRLDILPLDVDTHASAPNHTETSRLWIRALGFSALLGLIWLLLSGGRPPVPVPDVAAPLFWLGWAPATALSIMIFVAAESRLYGQRSTLGIAVLIIVAAAALSAWMASGSKGAIPVLVAFHLPLLVWIILGGAATLRTENSAVHRMSFILKSSEALVASGIYFGGAAIFGILTIGIFNVLGIHFPDAWINRCGAFTLGLLPVLAVASTYDPRVSPAEQDFSTGIARLMRLLCRLLIVPALAVLAIYVLWFIPRYFGRAFEERAVLLVYNASLAAVILLMVLAIPHLQEELSASWHKVLRRATKALCVLSLILNVYSLSAVLSRTIRMGITPNRHVVIGWNAVTLCFLASILVDQWRSDTSDYVARFRQSFARFLPLAAVWVLWVLLSVALFR